MEKRNPSSPPRARVCLCLLVLGMACAAGVVFKTDAARAPVVRVNRPALRRQNGRQDIRLRSLTTRASGRLTVEPSEGGGRARLTVMNLPDPRTLASDARTYVVWAVSGGRIVRLGELLRDERGNGGLAFERPEGFERYGVIVTAEPRADAARPSDPVLTTRADEAATLYPPLARDDRNTTAAPPPPVPTTRPRVSSRRPSANFYDEVDDALASGGGGRVIELDGEAVAPRARGAARATRRGAQAYVRANFRGVPLPSSVGANVYVLWGVIPDGRIVYMGSLPAADALNAAEVYVRAPGFDADDFTLFVTAERQRPAPSPSGRRVLTPRNSSLIVR